VDKNFISDVTEYIYSLENKELEFHFFSTTDGLTKWGNQIQLGFSCFAIKCLYILGEWRNVPSEKKNGWINFINSFQEENENFLPGSYIDRVFLDYYNSFQISRDLKNYIKLSINLVKPNKYETTKNRLSKTFVAESKQSIATLHQIESRNKIKYNVFPKNKHDINEYLNNFNWNKPWNAGAQFASLCVFSYTQLDSTEKQTSLSCLNSFIKNKLNYENGLYYDGPYPGSVESINGTMKVLTGLEWINTKIHYPEKIIDYCLDNKPNSEGCDLVDVVYVLYRCSSETNYRKKDISTYFDEIEGKIFQHYKPKEGGFSYFLNKSQTNYYNVPITKGYDKADLHGTTLLLWAVSLINNFRDKQENIFNIIKA